MSGSNGAYEVGKGRPPRASQFKPGQSGNLRGRPKGQKNFATEIEEVLTTPVSIKENGRSRKVTSRMAVLLRLCQMALGGNTRALEGKVRASGGNVRAIDMVLNLALRHATDQDAASSERKLSAAEDDILQRFFEQRVGHGDHSSSDSDEGNGHDTPS